MTTASAAHPIPALNADSRWARPLGALLPFVAGAAGAASLVALYVGLVTWAQGFGHARELLWTDRYWVGAIALGFGAQIGLYAYIRRVTALTRLRSAGAVTAAGTGASTAAMVACCAHHVSDVLPIVGLSAAAVFLNDYRLPVMSAGLAMNALGVAVLSRAAWRAREAARRCGAIR